LAARAHLKKLKSESLMFDATGNSQTRVVHGAPVEILRAPHYVKGETKANIIFRLTFAYSRFGNPYPFPFCSLTPRPECSNTMFTSKPHLTSHMTRSNNLQVKL
jgi:hypothetical protein